MSDDIIRRAKFFVGDENRDYAVEIARDPGGAAAAMEDLLAEVEALNHQIEGWAGDFQIVLAERDYARAEVERLWEENRNQAATIQRVRELLDPDNARHIADSGDVQQVFDWYLNEGEHRRSVDDWCETCSTPEGPVYHDPWPETGEVDVVGAVLAALRVDLDAALEGETDD